MTNGNRRESRNGNHMIAQAADASDEKAVVADRRAIEPDSVGSLHGMRRRTKHSILRTAVCSLWCSGRLEDSEAARLS